MDVRERAVYYLNIKPRTAAQVRTYLLNKGFDAGEIEETIRELKEYHYLDDLEFARQYLQYGFEKGRGLLRIKRELTEKGVSAEVIRSACDELEDEEELPDQRQMALDIAEQMICGIDPESLDNQEKQKLQAKIGRRLASRGFSSDVVYSVIRQVV